MPPTRTSPRIDKRRRFQEGFLAEIHRPPGQEIVLCPFLGHELCHALTNLRQREASEIPGDIASDGVQFILREVFLELDHAIADKARPRHDDRQHLL